MSAPLLRRAVAAAVLALAVAGSVLNGAGAASAAGPQTLPLTVELTSVTPALTGPDGVLVVKGTLVNGSTGTVRRPRVAPLFTRDPITERDELSDWAGTGTSDDELADLDGLRRPGGRVDLAATLAPGARLPFQLSLPVADLGWRADEADAGAYGLALEVRGDTGSGLERVGVRRTFVIWYPALGARPTQLSVLVPIEAGADAPEAAAKAASSSTPAGVTGAAATVSPSAGPTGTADDPDPDGGLPAGLSAQLAPGGRLDRVLTATASTQVAWALDPSLIEAAGSDRPPVTGEDTTAPTTTTTGTSPAVSPSPTGPTAEPPTIGESFLQRLLAARAGRDVSVLPWGDPDVAALTHSGAVDLLKSAQANGAAAANPLIGTLPDTSLAWPADGWADRATIDTLARTGHRDIVLNAEAYPPADELDHTPTGLSATSADGLTGLLADPTLSAELAATGSADSVAVTQRLLADLATITLQRPDEPRRLLAVVPRGWDPANPAAVRGALAALGAAPWVQLSPLSQLRAAAVPKLARRAAAYPGQARAAELPEPYVHGVDEARRRLARLGPVLAESRITKPLQTKAMALVSNGWRQRATDRARAEADFVGQVDKYYAGIGVAQDSVINLIAQTGNLPITVSNRLPYRVHVLLTLRPQNGRLRVEKSVPVDLEPFSTRQVQVPVRALASGSVDVEARIAGPDGNLLKPATLVRVRVFPALESRLLIGFGVALGLLLIGGVFRSARRTRVRMRPEDVPDLDDTHPEALEDAARTGAIPVLVPDPAPDGRAHGRDSDPAAQPEGAGRAPALARLGAPATPALALSTSALASTGGAPLSVTVAAPGSDPGPGADAGTEPAVGGGGGRGPGSAGPAGAADDNASTMRSSALMASGTLASRVLGLVSSAILAAAIGGIGDAPDAFSVANKVPNIAYILLIGGALNVVLVPQIVQAAKRPDGGRDYVDRLITLSLAVIAGLTLLCTLAAPLLVAAYSQGWTPQRFHLSVLFAYWCLPQLFFYGMYTVLGQVLNARGKFGAYMWAPVANNLVVITGMVAFMAWRTAAPGGEAQPASWWGPGEIAVVGGVATLGIAAQALVLVPVLRAADFHWTPRWGFRGVGLGTASRVAGWSLAAVVLNQLGFVAVQRAVTAAGAVADVAGSAAYDRAFLIYIVPHSLITVSLVTALFTRLSRAAASDDLAGVRADVSLGLRTTGVAMLLATAAFLALGTQVTATIFPGTSPQFTEAVAHGVMALAVGLVFFSAHYSFQRVFFAFDDGRTPFFLQVPVMALTAAGSVLSLVLLPASQVLIGVGVSISAANLAGSIVSAVVLRRRIGPFGERRIAGVYLRALLGAAAAAVAGWLVAQGVAGLFGHGRAATGLALLLGGAALFAVYAAVLRLLRVSELSDVFTPIVRRFARR